MGGDMCEEANKELGKEFYCEFQFSYLIVQRGSTVATPRACFVYCRR